MDQTYPIMNEIAEFYPAVEQFALLLGRLQSKDTVALEHEEVENLISSDGTEVLRQLLQGHLDFRSTNEIKVETISGSDGIVRSHRRKSCKKDLETAFGTVKVTRLGYSTRGG